MSFDRKKSLLSTSTRHEPHSVCTACGAEEIEMLNKFATRRVVLTYMPTDGDKEIFPEINECLSCWTREFFGYVEQIGVLSMHIFVSRNSDLFELVEFIANEILIYKASRRCNSALLQADPFRSVDLKPPEIAKFL